MMILVGTVMHSADLAVRVGELREMLSPQLRWIRVRYWLVPLALLAVVAVVNILGAAGSVTNRPFDDETHVVAQVERLASTGALADPIGYPRTTQLGGHVTLGALFSPFGDARLVRVIDRGVGLALFLLLACSRLRAREAESAIWCSLLVVLAAAFKTATNDLLPLWLPAGLILAMHVTLMTSTATGRALLPLGLLAGGLCALRVELAPVAIGFLVAAWWPARDWRRAALLVGGMTLTALGYVIARQLAWASVDATAVLALAGNTWPLLLRLGLFVAIAGAAFPLIALASREHAARGLDDRPLRWFAFSAGLGVAGVVSRFAGTPPLSVQLLWPIAIAGFAVLAITLCGQLTLRYTGLVLAVLACVLVFEAQDASGRRAWAWRYYDLMFDVQHARDLAPAYAHYGELLAGVPAGERVALWVVRPELVDPRDHVIFDLRTPRAAKVGKLDALLRASRARWLLVESAGEPGVARLVEKGVVVLSRDGVQLVELR